MITSVKLNGLEIGVSTAFTVGQDTLSTLMAAPERDPVMVDRPGTFPAFIRSQILPKPVTLTVILKRQTISQRADDFDTLTVATGAGVLVPLLYVEDGTTFTFMAHCSGPVPDPWYARAAVSAIIPNPVPVIT